MVAVEILLNVSVSVTVKIIDVNFIMFIELRSTTKYSFVKKKKLTKTSRLYHRMEVKWVMMITVLTSPFFICILPLG